MIRSGRAASQWAWLTALLVTIATVTSLFEGIASAQVRVSSLAAPPRSAAAALADVKASAGNARRREHRAVQPIRDSLSTIDFGRIDRQGETRPAVQTTPSGRKRSVTRRILGGAIGATGGFFAGGFLGAAIEGDRCHCDDPGLRGALIGAPVGAVAGGILGAMFF